MVHRSPGRSLRLKNILLTNKGEAKVADFGLKAVQLTLQRGTGLVDTVGHQGNRERRCT